MVGTQRSRRPVQGGKLFMSDRKFGFPDRQQRWRVVAMTAIGLIVALVGAACSGAGGGGGSSKTLTVAAVDNPQMADLKKLVADFHSAHPYIAKSSSYDVDDLIPGIRTALSYQNNLYAVPFYGESSMLMYRKDLLAAKGVTMPDHPTWDQVAAAAKAVNSSSVNGICLRGLPGWGEQLAPLDTVVNTFGGRWYDEKWNAQLNSPQWKSAVNFYTSLLKDAGEPGAGNAGFTECLNAYNSGKVAMWYDATVAASFFTGDAAKNSGYAYAPTKVKDWSGWLWAWALGMPSSSKKKDAAWTFADWATNKAYIQLVGTKLGWQHVSPGTRTSTYDLPEYKAAAGAFADVTLQSIAHADVTHPTVDPVPYIGVQYVDIDEFQQLGDQVSQEFAKVLAGGETVDQAL